MDVVRKKRKSRKWLKWGVVVIVVSATIAGTTFALSSLENALPEFDRASVLVAEVERGTMVRDVRAPGTLVPEEMTFVTTEVAGTVVEVLVQPGDRVGPETELLKLRDPQMERAIRDAERNVESANVSVERFLLQHRAEELNLRVAREDARANYEDARETAELNETLARRELISRRQWENSRDAAERNRMRFEVQLARELNSQKTFEIQLAERKAAVTSATDWLEERLEQQEALVVLAGVSGVVQDLGATGNGLDVDQRVGQGALVARITDPSRLRAELQVSQSLAQDIVQGQPVSVDTHNGVIEGRVRLVNPSVQNDRVPIDVELIGELPRGARPDLSVEGLIEVSRINDTLFVRKPTFARENRIAEVFRIEPDGQTAVRTLIEFGSTAAYTIEIVSGLKPGDEVVISETSRWKSFDRVTLK